MIATGRAYSRRRFKQPQFAAWRESAQTWIALRHPLGHQRFARLRVDPLERLGQRFRDVHQQMVDATSPRSAIDAIGLRQLAGGEPGIELNLRVVGALSRGQANRGVRGQRFQIEQGCIVDRAEELPLVVRQIGQSD